MKWGDESEEFSVRARTGRMAGGFLRLLALALLLAALAVGGILADFLFVKSATKAAIEESRK